MPLSFATVYPASDEENDVYEIEGTHFHLLINIYVLVVGLNKLLINFMKNVKDGYEKTHALPFLTFIRKCVVNLQKGLEIVKIKFSSWH